MLKKFHVWEKSFKFFSLALLVILLASLKTQGQTTISGTVTNSTGYFLENVTVQLNGSKTVGTTTDNKGNFSLTLPSSEGTLNFSMIGYRPRNVLLNSRKILNVVLLEDSSYMNDVIVTGYTTTLRKDLTGEVGTVNMADLQKAPVGSFDEALAGRVAGVQVSSQSGRPGAGIDIFIRGPGSLTQSTSPLYVIDGFPLENPDNSVLDPQNIESITVLKDASATALYGAKGSNGVIVITTKKGVAGAAKVNYYSYFGQSTPEKYLNLMSPYQFVQLQSSAYPGANSFLTDGKVLEDYRNVKGVDWQKELLRSGFQQNQSLSVSGGTNGTRYLFSGNYFTQDGIMINSSFRRYQMKVSLDQTIGKKGKIGGSITYTGNLNTGSDPQASGASSIFYQVYTYAPIVLSGSDSALLNSLFDPDGTGQSTDFRINPVLNLQNQIRKNIRNNIIANVYINYNITKDLLFTVRGSANNTYQIVQSFNGSNTQSGSPIGSNQVNGSVVNYRNEWYDNTNLLTYNKNFGRQHHLNVVIGTEVQKNQTQAWGYSSKQIPVEGMGLGGIATGTINIPPTGTLSSNTAVSGIGSLSYNFGERYYLTGNFRADGSSKFIGDNRWGYFPSGAFMWKFTNEKFIPKNDILTDGNFRFSYGVTGNNRVSDFATYQQIGFTTPLTLYGVAQPQSATVNSLPNPNLRWETNKETNIGMDLGFFNGRFNLTAAVYNRRTDNLLYQSQLPGSTGFTSSTVNIASISNKGLELTLAAQIINHKDFTYTSNFNISFNKNRLNALSDPTQDGLLSSVNWEALFNAIPQYDAKIGGPLGQIYGLVADGLYQYKDFDKLPNGTYVLKPGVVKSTFAPSGNPQPGNQKFIDENHDGIIDVNDRVIIGNGFPINFGGWGNNFRYKNFDVSVFFQWSYGNYIINGNRQWFSTGMGIQQRGGPIPFQNAFAEYANRWTPTNQNTDIPSFNSVADQLSSQFVENGSYLRLKTINIGYTFPKSWLSKMKIQSFRIYIATTNLFTLTKYKGYDPEVSAFQTVLTPGVDYSSYPRPYTIVGGFNLIF